MTETSLGGDNVRFQPTLWTTIVRARDAGGPEAREAMGRLVERYWKPLYFFARRQGNDIEASKDLTQSFFARVVEGSSLKDVAPENGRFRNWLLAAMSHHLSNAREKENALKRGGAELHVDFALAEQQLAGSADPAEKLFLRAWATEVINGAMMRLRSEWSDRHGDFDILRQHLSGPEASYKEIAAKLGKAEHDIKNLLHRMRTRLRELLKEEVAGSVDDPSQVDEELAALFSALS